MLYPASGSGSGPASRPSPRSSTPISRALPAQTSHEHVRPWVVNNYTKFICLRGSSDGANQFISATAIQLTPSYPSCHKRRFDWFSRFSAAHCCNQRTDRHTDDAKLTSDLIHLPVLQSIYPFLVLSFIILVGSVR